MSERSQPLWAEAVQLVPVVVLALPFVVAGEVDLQQAGTSFLIAAPLFVAVSVGLLARQHVLNPIAVGTGLWLIGGAIALGVPLEPVATWLADTQAWGLFAASLAVGAVATFGSPQGYIGARGDLAWIRKASLGLLGLTVVVVAWSWAFRHDVRLGGGLPFIVLNVARRLMIARRTPSA